MRYQSISRIPLQIMIIPLVEKCKDRPNFHSTILIAEITMMELLAPMENLADKLARLKGTAIPSKSLKFPFFYWLLPPPRPRALLQSNFTTEQKKMHKRGKSLEKFSKVISIVFWKNAERLNIFNKIGKNGNQFLSIHRLHPFGQISDLFERQFPVERL